MRRNGGKEEEEDDQQTVETCKFSPDTLLCLFFYSSMIGR